MIKILNARLVSEFTMEIDFSDHTQGVFDAASYLSSRSGPLLDKLRDAAYFCRFFIDVSPCAGPMAWRFHLPKFANFLRFTQRHSWLPLK